MSQHSTLIVNADDFGMSLSSTLGVVSAHRDGIVSSTSLVVTTEGFDFARKMLREECPDVGVGLHFCLTAGRPVSSPAEVFHLVDKNGYFSTSFSQLLAALLSPRKQEWLAQIRKELHAQFEKALQNGIPLDHLNSERHVHLIPPIFKLLVELAREKNIKFIRTTSERGGTYLTFSKWIRVLASAGPLKSALLSAFSRLNKKEITGPLKTADHFCSLLTTGRMDLILERILENPLPGVTEIAVHPGDIEKASTSKTENPQLDHYLSSEGRRQELLACVKMKSKIFPGRIVKFSELSNGSRGSNEF